MSSKRDTPKVLRERTNSSNSATVEAHSVRALPAYFHFMSMQQLPPCRWMAAVTSSMISSVSSSSSSSYASGSLNSNGRRGLMRSQILAVFVNLFLRVMASCCLTLDFSQKSNENLYLGREISGVCRRSCGGGGIKDVLDEPWLPLFFFFFMAARLSELPKLRTDPGEGGVEVEEAPETGVWMKDGDEDREENDGDDCPL